MSEAVPKTVTAKFSLEPIDTVRAYQLHYWHRLLSKTGLLTIAVGLALVVALGPALLPGDRAGIAAVWVVALTAGLATPFVRARWFIPRTARRVHAQQKALHEPMDVAFDAGGLSLMSASGTSTTPWTHVRMMREDAHVMLFYHSDALFQFVPKRFLATAEVDEVQRLYAAARGRPTLGGR